MASKSKGLYILYFEKKADIIGRFDLFVNFYYHNWFSVHVGDIQS